MQAEELKAVMVPYIGLAILLCADHGAGSAADHYREQRREATQHRQALRGRVMAMMDADWRRHGDRAGCRRKCGRARLAPNLRWDSPAPLRQTRGKTYGRTLALS